ncbi:MAG: hypothetical protein N4A46_09185 [Schleiferiaceae bacterium]|jgi:membrane-bound ClpP family serine protease|nr:hypothetical protein [Schleiferiaceae bacterium]
MKQFLFGVAILGVLLIMAGIFFRSSELTFLKHGVSAGLAIFTFIWVPIFLFYAYDRKQRKRELEEQESDDNIE